VNRSRPECGVDGHQGKSRCPKCGQELALPKDGSPQEQRPSDPTSELNRTKLDQASAATPAVKAAEQQGDQVPSQTSNLENDSSRNMLLFAYTVGGTLGVALALFLGGVLPLAVLMLSTMGLAVKILWVLAAGLLLALAIFLLIRAEPASTSSAHPEGLAPREPPTKEASAHSGPSDSVQRPNGHE
jgi:hypothetical protein